MQAHDFGTTSHVRPSDATINDEQRELLDRKQLRTYGFRGAKIAGVGKGATLVNTVLAFHRWPGVKIRLPWKPASPGFGVLKAFSTSDTLPPNDCVGG